MSKARGKNTKPDVASTSEDVLVTVEAQGTSPDTLPFAEWSDQEINLEKWDTTAGKDKTSHLQQKILFEDTQQVHLPPSVKVDCWKRCSEIFPNGNLVIFINKNSYPDLVKANAHLLHSSFYRNFITSIEILLYLGCTRQVPEEYGGAGFAASLSRSWRPWHHIYSNCKVVKTQSEHTPLYNSAGKYAVRLFWMGTWRKIYVDDMIPIDKMGDILLPSLHAAKQDSEQVEPVKSPKTTKSKGSSPSRKEAVEIWSLILSKALLKIASLSWNSSNELNDFDIIQCLTGWVPIKIRTKDITSNEIWEILQAYVHYFEWDGDKKDVTAKKNKGSKKADSKAGKKKKMVIPSGIENMQDGDYFVIASCKNFHLSTMVEQAERVSHDVVIGLVRDIPLVQPPPRPDLEFWKTFRYEEWATEQGILPPDIKKMNIKSLNIVSPFQTLIQKASIGDDANESTELDNTDKKSEVSSKSSKKSSKLKGTKNILEPDPSFWINFSELQDTLENITIYFQPRIFKSKAKISDINFLHKTDAFKQITNPIELHQSRNEPIYLFSDSIDAKFIVINYSQVGNVALLEIQNDELSLHSEHNDINDLDVCVNILLKKTREDISKDQSQSKLCDTASVQSFNLKYVNFLMEQYNWKSNSFGRAIANIQTVGSKSIILELKPGRSAFRLWISSHCSYVLQIFSDTPMTVGCLEEFYSGCAIESQLLTNKCFELSSCFGKLIQAFGLPDYPNALRNFYRVYKPTTYLNKKDLILMHNAFLTSLFETITDNSNTSNGVECVKLLLLQLKTFDYVSPYLDDAPHLCPSAFERDDQIIYAKTMERAAIKIQAFFKGLYIRLQLKKMNEKHKEYMRKFTSINYIL
ncbi:uncharacterized protein LOC143195685 [Rhynchophorus ferrugineus]|uniref:uncharacterized protein LOC143195685 n=1 Tax=Rhynchophorus ferrugineus TaxID=354439 RepID=UPI003FCC4899